MTPTQVEALLIGKIIKSVKWHSYLGWAMCVDEIEFTDGTILDVGGNADFGRLDAVILPNGSLNKIERPRGVGEGDYGVE